MKRFTYLFLSITILIIMLPSCVNDTVDNVNFVNDRYIYRVDGRKLYRYDLVNKTCTLACPDPLCKHGDDCPVSKLEDTETAITDRYIFLSRREISDYESTMYVYDLATNEIKELARGTEPQPVEMANEYAFFTMARYEYNEDGNIEKKVYDLYRYNTETGEIKILNSEPLVSLVNFLTYNNERITWYGDAYGCFSSDYDFNNVMEEVYLDVAKSVNTVNGHTYMSSFKRDEYGSYLHGTKTNIETGETITLFEKAESSRFANQETRSGYLYRPTEIVLVEIDGEEKYIRRGINKIVYVSTEDPSKTFEFQLSENIVTATVGAHNGSKWYLGDYTSTKVAVYSYDEQGNRYLSTGMFVINCETGESFVIENEDTKRSYPVQKIEEDEQ